MKKLTAGIFAGILTIVTVNAADAAIATSGYVTEKVGAVDAKVGTLDDLKTSAKGSTVAAINEVNATLELKADKATVGTPDSGKTVVQMIKDVQTAAGTDVADKLGGTFSKDSTVQDALNLKADKTQLGGNFTAENTVADAIDNITAADTGLIDTKISAAKEEIKGTTDGLGSRLTTAEGNITANTNAITTLNGTGDGSVKKQIDTAIAGVNTAAEALEGRVTANETKITKLDGDDTVDGSVKKQIKDAIAGVDIKLADKQNLLNGKNVSTTGEGNVVSSVSAVDGVVTATKGINAVTVPTSNTPSESGTYVLTATVENGKPTYYWENIQRATTPSENP